MSRSITWLAHNQDSRHDEQIVDRLLDHFGLRSIVLADKVCDAGRIRELVQAQGVTSSIPLKNNLTLTVLQHAVPSRAEPD